MTVRARLFAGLRERAGRASIEVEVGDGSTVTSVYEALRHSLPGLPEPRMLRAARNDSFCGWEEPVADGDEVAFLPPVSGGVEEPWIEVTTEVIDVPTVEDRVRHSGAGAVCTFTGLVRDHSGAGSVTHLEYEAYEPMAQREMRRLAEEVLDRWPGARVAIVHRVGRLELQEASVVISVSCPHRAEAFEACRWAIDQLKESVPIWKKEFRPDGSAWIEGES